MVLPDLEKKLPKNDMISKGLQELTGTIDNIDSLGKRSKVQVDLRIVRGISYYDGTVFEAYDQAGEDVGAVFGGGRFDKLCRIYGKRDMPATGVAGGFERLMISLEKKGLFPDLEQNPQVYVAMDYASSAKVRIVVIVGPRELKEGNLRLRDMKTGEERNVPKSRIVDEITGILS
jgi:histidyl-tRNA synthetase